MIKLDWEKVNGLIPAIIQDHQTLQVLMLGYMNKEALEISQSTGMATFFSRTRQKLWTKGETSGNNLKIKKITHDCDNDTLLVLAENNGPTCHLGRNSCFEDSPSSFNEIGKLEEMIDLRFTDMPGTTHHITVPIKFLDKDIFPFGSLVNVFNLSISVPY